MEHITRLKLKFMADKQQINIELNPDVAEGTYANLAIISHSSSEFILDFVRMMPGIPKANVQSRIILTPEHAKRLMLALQENIQRYEAHMGAIKLHNPQSPPTPPHFTIPQGEA